ncbi:hypothetical protein GJ496_010036 [Pomphorhynchus laevis]|nr:hypothetical protein GJ496_010036 [Pomphorhynchus laevis]
MTLAVFNDNHPPMNSELHTPTQTTVPRDATIHCHKCVSPPGLYYSLNQSNLDDSSGTGAITLCDIHRFDPPCVILAVLFNFCLSCGYMPNTWRCHRSFLIPKSGKLVNGDHYASQHQQLRV